MRLVQIENLSLEKQWRQRLRLHFNRQFMKLTAGKDSPEYIQKVYQKWIEKFMRRSNRLLTEADLDRISRSIKEEYKQ